MARLNKSRERPEADSTYFLKILLYFVVGSIWLRSDLLPIPLPVGLIVGILFASHDHFQIDRKIEYALLLVAAVVSLVAPIGIVLDLGG